MLSVTNDLVSDKGALTARKDGLATRSKFLDDRAATEQKRLDQMEAQLRKQFTEMDSTVAANNALINSLPK